MAIAARGSPETSPAPESRPRGGTTRPWHEWQYVKVGRLFPYVEESIDYGTQWAVFEPNEEPLSELNTH
jgi:hypothetical protein